MCMIILCCSSHFFFMRKRTRFKLLSRLWWRFHLLSLISGKLWTNAVVLRWVSTPQKSLTMWLKLHSWIVFWNFEEEFSRPWFHSNLLYCGQMGLMWPQLQSRRPPKPWHCSRNHGHRRLFKTLVKLLYVCFIRFSMD